MSDLGRLASIGRQLRTQVLQSEDDAGSCGRVVAATRIFSDDEQSVSTLSAQSHAINRVHLSSEIEEQHKEKLQEILNLLRKKKKEAQAVLTHEKERMILCKVVVPEYMKMHQFLKEEEQLQLQLLDKEERENLKKLRENEVKLTQQVRPLTKMIGQIECMYQNSNLDSFEERLRISAVLQERVTAASMSRSHHHTTESVPRHWNEGDVKKIQQVDIVKGTSLHPQPPNPHKVILKESLPHHCVPWVCHRVYKKDRMYSPLHFQSFPNNGEKGIVAYWSHGPGSGPQALRISLLGLGFRDIVSKA
ncbi:Putative E3 ubiquitin-protein ligase TRIML1 [Fukomys damarensis]|uniref:Putative E3 ubiquitin-protein ligase TRIML1 n=1 Tax=Fukomys damarensis TaxID=885580 RepID=A0A091DSM8_FUKDA|nr:Putative E3 ubiquitin-protein ligase TRIML1 [Fukomys damarensis]